MLTLTDEMYERLIGLVTDARVAAVNAENETRILRQERDRDYGEFKQKMDKLETSVQEMAQSVIMMGVGFSAIEEDLNDVQKAIRDHSMASSVMGQEVHNMAQSLDGITQLTKSLFDQQESLRQSVHGEGARKSQHGDEASGQSQ